MRQILLSLFLLSTFCATAQNLPTAKKKRISTTSYMVSASQYNYSTVARDITQGCRTSYDCAKALYLWICDNISYDSSLKIRTADECWRQRRGVCQGYCELYYRLAETLGIKTDLIYGQVKLGRNDRNTEKHVWLQIRTERGIHLLDPTWGAGKIINGKFERNTNPLLWFDVNPSWLIFTHLPKKEQHQYLKETIDAAKFASLPYATPELEMLGMIPNKTLSESLTDRQDFPLINPSMPTHISFLSVPCRSVLSPASGYQFIVKGLGTDETLCITDASGNVCQTDRQAQGDTHTLTFSPTSSGKHTLCLSRSNGFFTRLFPMVEYEVK